MQFKIPGKVYTNSTDAYMGINDNYQVPGENKVNEVHNYQHGTKPVKLIFYLEIKMTTQR